MKTEFNYLWIFLLTCCYFHASPSQVTAKSRKPEVVRIRQVAQCLLYNSGASYRQAGEIAGGIDANATRYNVLKIKSLIEPGRGQDRQLLNDLNNLTKIIQGWQYNT